MGPIERESEFDPATCTAEFVTAEVDEPISVVLERVEIALGRTPNVVVILPRRSYAFHSTHDFLALGKLHSGREVRIAIATPDPTVSSLARVLGFHTQPLPPGHPYLDQPPPTEAELQREGLETPTEPLPLAEVQEWVLAPSGIKYQAPSTTSTTSTTSTWLNYAEPSKEHGSVMGNNAVDQDAQPAPAAHSRSGVPPPRRKPRQTSHLQLQPAVITDPSLPSITGDRFTPVPPLVSTTASGRIKARRTDDEAHAYNKLDQQEGVRVYRRQTARRVVTGVLLFMLLALVGGGVYAYVYLPEGTVEVTPGSSTLNPISVEIPVITSPAAAQGGGTAGTAGAAGAAGTVLGAGNKVAAHSVQATQLSATIVFSGTAPATGSRTINKGFATGSLRFTNLTSGPIQVPQGTHFKSANGIDVQVVEGGTIKGTLFGAYGSQVPGILDLPVQATEEGPTGNVAAGQIQGTWNGSASYTNGKALAGGTTQTSKLVAQSDIDALTANLTAKVGDQADALALIESKVPTGEQIITQTFALAQPSIAGDHKANDEADAVHVTVSATVQAFSYKVAEVQDAVKQAVYDWVQTEEPAGMGPSLEPDSIQFGTPIVASVDTQTGQIVYSTTATGRVDYNFTPTLKNQLLQLVQGKKISEARAEINSRFGKYISVASIQGKVLGFTLDHMPSDPTRITVESTKP